MLSIFKKIKKYLELRYNIARLDIIEKTIIVVSFILVILIIIILSSVILLILSFALANYLGKLWNDLSLAFLAVAGLDMLLLLIFIIFRDRLVLEPLSKKLINNLVKQHRKEEDEEINI